MSEDDLLSKLPLELQLHIADAVGERCDRASLALASPRLLGLAACRELPSYQGWLGDVNRLPRRAWGRGRRAAASHVRQSLRGKRSKAEAKAQVAGLAAAADLRVELRLAISGSCQVWHLVQPDSTVGALLVTRSGEPEPRKVTWHYEGEAGAEHLVCHEAAGGSVNHYKGEKGAERLVCLRAPSGSVTHFKGEKDAERIVRCKLLRGDVLHLEGEKGAERVVCIELPSGEVRHFEGERGVERLVRSELPYGGLVCNYEGEKGAEQLVLLELPYGGVIEPEDQLIHALLERVARLLG